MLTNGPSGQPARLSRNEESKMVRWTILSRNASATGLVIALLGCGQDSPQSLVASAKQYVARNDRPAAVVQLKNALQRRPDLAEARFLLGESLVHVGDGTGAEIELRKALEGGYPEDEINPVLARALVMRGQYKTVVESFADNAPTATPLGAAELNTAIGQARLALGDRDAAQTAFARALSLQEGYAPALLGQASIKASRRDLDGALSLIDAALASNSAFVEGHRARGDLLGAKGQYDEALAAYRKAVELKRNDMHSLSRIVMLLAERGELDEADKQVRTLKKLAPKQAQPAYLQAMLDYRRKNFTAARQAIQESLHAAPDSLPGLLLAGAIEYQLKSYETSEASIRRVLQGAPNHPVANRLMVVNHLASGQHSKALESLNSLLQIDGNQPATLELAGETFLQNGNPTVAARYFEKAATLAPQDVSKRTGLALSRFAMGASDPAFRELEEAAALDPDTRADMALVATSLDRKQYDRALAAIDRLEKKQPGKPLSHNLRGAALLGKGDMAGARKSFEQALSLDPAFFAATANLVGLDLREKRPDAAITRMEAFLARNPKHAQAWLAMAELRARTKAKPGEVASLIAKAVAANPAGIAPRRALIGHYLQANEPAKAVTAAREALSAVPERPELLDVVGRALEATGELQQARSTYSRWAQLQPKSPVPWLRLADVDIAGGDSEAALKSLRKALELKPDFVDAQRRIIAIDVRTNRAPRALAVAREVQRQRPTEAAGYMLEGDIHAAKQAWNEAAAIYQAGLKQADSPHLATRLHAAMRSARMNAEADRLVADWVTRHPKDKVVRLYLAQSAAAGGDYPLSIKQYRELLELEPANPLYLNNLAWVAGRVKDPAAIQYAERAVALAPDNPSVLDTLGVLLVEKGDTTRGIDLLRKAAALAPQRSEIRLNLAKSLIAAGQKDAAKQELRELEKLGDKFSAHAEVQRLIKAQ